MLLSNSNWGLYLMKKIYSINSDFINARIDRWFRKNVCEVPQSLIQKNLRKGNIKVNKKKVKSSYKLQKNDQVSLYNINFFLKILGTTR